MKEGRKAEYPERRLDDEVGHGWRIAWPSSFVYNCLLVGCLTYQQHASVSQGRICSDNFNFSCCHTEREVADSTFYLTQSQYTDTGPTSPSADTITPGAWQGSHWSANFEVTGMTPQWKNPFASGIRTRDFPLSRRTPTRLTRWYFVYKERQQTLAVWSLSPTEIIPIDSSTTLGTQHGDGC